VSVACPTWTASQGGSEVIRWYSLLRELLVSRLRRSALLSNGCPTSERAPRADHPDAPQFWDNLALCQ